jgi:hypothetical protein
VYGARNQNGKYIAIKQKIQLGDPMLMQKSTQSFLSEIQALSSLEHPNIVKFQKTNFIQKTMLIAKCILFYAQDLSESSTETARSIA